MRGAGRPPYAHPILPSGFRPDASDATVRETDTITHAPCFGHSLLSLGGQSLLKVADGRAPNGAGRDHPAPFVPSIARASREDTRRVLGTRRRSRFARRRNSVVVSPTIPAGQWRPPTTSTGHEAVRITRSATLPINNRRTPVRPWVPMTTRSTRLFLAAHGREQPLEVISILRVSSAHILSAV